MPVASPSARSQGRIAARAERWRPDRGSSSRRAAGRASSARASETRWRSPPERPRGTRFQVLAEFETFHDLHEGDGRIAFLIAAAPLGVAEVALDGQVIEQGRLLEGEPDSPAIRRHEDAAAVVLPGGRPEGEPSGKAGEAGDRAEERRLAAAGGTEDRSGFPGPGLEGSLDPQFSDRPPEPHFERGARAGHRSRPPILFWRVRVSATTTNENASRLPDSRCAVPHSMSSTWS